MKVLVYGAGVLGSYLAHSLLRGGNNVSILARGRRYEQLKEDGIVIRHRFQRKNTVDAVNVIDKLQPEEHYDLIFVVMKYNQFSSVLPILAENISNNIVIVGNNADAANMQTFLNKNSKVKKNIAFGFQISGGRREENGRVIFIRGGGQMVIGSLHGDLSFKSTLEKAFKEAKHKLSFNENIDGWLKSHFIPIIAMNSIHYINNFDFKKIAKDKNALMQMISVMDEGFMVLEKLGYRIDPAFQVNMVRNHRNFVYHGLRIFHKLQMAKFFECSFSEIIALYETFDELKKEANISTPNLDDLQKRSTSKYRDEVNR
ncbi:ketopantoate reductase family protein [Bacillus amyloliquefaciens]|uniref:ketopantoate reductase family protein n=1 Tax=Bacillus amyloliquefaciens TaxID=1390 RepID=UPI002809BEC6|nr:2-dehydropantoate 2-reductase N-terminal domain-containing protein [Bacillus amyloliquefaciens]MDQ8094646.1 2-dehydropantoate 2-reductase N-terminal domain-containing protein [Bacillus amyloliquefaciens]